MLESALLGRTRSVPISEHVKIEEKRLRGQENGTVDVRNQHVVNQTSLLHHGV